MSITTYEIKCAKCNVAIQGPADADADTMVGCSVCGVKDTKENIEREVADYVTQRTADALSAKLEGIANKFSWMTHERGARDDKHYRFIVDFDPPL